MSTFSLIYKLKWSQSSNEWNVEDIIIFKTTLLQLQKWIASLNWFLIHWLDSLEQLQVFERCCDKYENWNYYIKTESSTFNNLEYVSAYELIDWFEPLDKDITNDLLLELWISQYIKNSHKLPWFIKDNYINIKWVEIELKENTKYGSIFEIIYEANLNKNKNDFSYGDLIEICEKWNYTKVSKKDLKYDKIRDSIKHKLKEIREKTKIKFIWLHKDKIVLWEK